MIKIYIIESWNHNMIIRASKNSPGKINRALRYFLSYFHPLFKTYWEFQQHYFFDSQNQWFQSAKLYKKSQYVLIKVYALFNLFFYMFSHGKHLSKTLTFDGKIFTTIKPVSLLLLFIALSVIILVREKFFLFELPLS